MKLYLSPSLQRRIHVFSMKIFCPFPAEKITCLFHENLLSLPPRRGKARLGVFFSLASVPVTKELSWIKHPLPLTPSRQGREDYSLP